MWRVPVLCGVLCLSMPAWAARFVELPEAQSLKLRVVRYTGGTNGTMIVEVRNGAGRAAKFSAQGLYFVPQGDPEKAPQRLGAAGPFEVEQQGQWSSQQSLTVAPRQTVRVKLQVFCIDSHRASPGADHPFALARKRLPPQLRREITTQTKDVLRKAKGHLGAAKADMQSEIWKTRDKKWIKLEGERAQEKQSAPLRRRHQRIDQQAPQLQQ